MHQCSLFILTLLCVTVQDISGSWEEWWTYDGISGPGFWGLINPQWSMCNKGRRQSPVNIEPDKLLFDPWLRDIQFDKHKVSGVLQNTGQSLVFRVEKDSKHQVNISGGPLSYRYQFEEIYFHYGMEDNRGSEHQIDHHTFPGEIQLYGFNKELYHNMSEAQHKSQGIVGISLMVQVGEPTNTDFRLITSAFNKVTYRGSSFPIKHLPLSSLLPNTQQYLTYEGSTTHPGCWETAVWIIFNKPIYISKQEMYALRQLMQGSQLTPKAPLANNARPVQPLHHRTVRTNINFNKQGLQGSNNCPDMYRNMHYTVIEPTVAKDELISISTSMVLSNGTTLKKLHRKHRKTTTTSTTTNLPPTSFNDTNLGNDASLDEDTNSGNDTNSDIYTSLGIRIDTSLKNDTSLINESSNDTSLDKDTNSGNDISSDIYTSLGIRIDTSLKNDTRPGNDTSVGDSTSLVNDTNLVNSTILVIDNNLANETSLAIETSLDSETSLGNSTRLGN